MDIHSAGKWFSSITGPACLVPYANMRRGGATNKCKQPEPKVRTEKQGHKSAKPNKTQSALSIQ